MSWTGTSNCILQYLWTVITCPCPWYLLLPYKSHVIPAWRTTVRLFISISMFFKCCISVIIFLSYISILRLKCKLGICRIWKSVHYIRISLYRSLKTFKLFAWYVYIWDKWNVSSLSPIDIRKLKSLYSSKITNSYHCSEMERPGFSNERQLGCLVNRWFGVTSNEISKICNTGHSFQGIHRWSLDYCLKGPEMGKAFPTMPSS